jgi:putative heme-binding domain-containing protein
MRLRSRFYIVMAVGMLFTTAAVRAQWLEDELRQIPFEKLAASARESGDAARGAVVFFQPHMACFKCHTVGDSSAVLPGPDLTKLGHDTSDESLVESVLLPSNVIRKEFQSVTVVTMQGKSITGLLVEQSDTKLVVRSTDDGGDTATFAIDELDDWKLNDTSLMPAGQINQLNSRQQFLDLIRYLMEVRDGGAVRALELKPPASLMAFTVPEYEKQVDHAGLIGSWGEESLKRGEIIYQRVCANCHGTIDSPGSLPNSLRFAEGTFKNGSDPLSMYRTLTHGFGLMAPQSWMVPSQKYDVIHYLRESYIRSHNPTQFVPVDEAYLASLPQGTTRGPEASSIEPWSAMDYGPSLTHTYEVPGSKHNLAYKGIAIRLDPGAGGVSRGRHWMVFDTDTLRMAAAWSGAGNTNQNFIDWQGIQFDGVHGVHPRLVGETAFVNSTGPGWANPADGGFKEDQRVLGRDGLRYGPMPRDWGRFRGLYHHGPHVVLSYSVGSTDVLEWPRLLVLASPNTPPLFARTFNFGPRSRDLLLRVAEIPLTQEGIAVGGKENRSTDIFGQREPAEPADAEQTILAGLAPKDVGAQWERSADYLQLRIPAGRTPLRFTLWLPADTASVTDGLQQPSIPDADFDLTSFTRGGPPQWAQALETELITGPDDRPFAADVLTAPEINPWLANMRFTGLDFFPDGCMAVCTWDGDVWLVRDLPSTKEVGQPRNRTTLRWQRIATGMFQPLGLKIVDNKIHVTCRDQLAVLHDLNGDGAIDFYQCLNNDHQVTEHFHEFAMGLQTDAKGNFYYAKSGCHGKAAVVPHHGTLLRISPDGASTDILANGFRAANGVCLNPDGSFFVTDQEGFWNPKNRINWVTVNPHGPPHFYGNMLGYHDVTSTSDDAMIPPLCWITNEFDRSPAELLWVDSDRWGPLKGSLLNLSYGNGKVFLVPHENVQGVMQGGMIELPLAPFQTGVMRGRFHPLDQHLYLCGMFAWAGNATHPGGLYRIRPTGLPIYLPIGLKATTSGLILTFTKALDPASVTRKNFQIKTWSLKRTANYGSEHYHESTLDVEDAVLSKDGREVRLRITELCPTWCMEIRFALQSAMGSPVTGILHNTIHRLGQ